MYLTIDLIVLGAALLIAGLAVLFGARVSLRAAALSFVALVVATAVFDNVMIAVGLFTYDHDTLLGVYLGRAPVEDFAYPLLAIIMLPALWELFGRWKSHDVRTVVRSSRPISWVNTAYPFAAAYLLTTGEIGLPLIIGTLFFLVPYNMLMYGVNDVFDYESDLRNPRKGGVEGAVLPKRLHRPVLIAATVLTVPGAGYLLAIGSLQSGILLVLCLAGVLAYSVPPLRFKERPVLDSVTSSLHFVGPAIVGLSLGGVRWDAQLVALLLAFFFWGCASHAFGAVQDVIADREAGISSTATVWGARLTARLAIGLYLAAGIVVLFSGWPGPLAALLVVPYLVVVAPSWNVTDATSAGANRGWRWFLWLNQFTGFGVTMLLIWFAMSR
ncbi:prenyltransferase [Lysinibacter cavernae]|nr:prenyltransferase [Lysinibacter cavernae]